MLADYVMKRIDNLFSDRLKCKELPRKTKDSSAFDKEVIRKSLHKVIRKDQPTETQPYIKNTEPVSPVSKSKLKLYLQTNREERISSVLKGQRLPLESENSIGVNRNNHRSDHSISKENNVTRFYQQMRKSTQKSQQRSKSPKRGLQVSKVTPNLIRNASKRCIGGMRV